ncbi:MAG: DUF1648 domain-containing protein [Deltaproteobacteria bacterium]|nr:DUF1648 domain-containing protein [Deltaproteobacteria bacterium]
MLRWLSPLLLILGLLVLLLLWGRVPEVWPVHWGPGGQPDGWSHKEGVTAFLPFLLGALVWAALEAVALFVVRQGKALPVLSSGYVAMVRWVAVAIVLATVYTGLALPLLQPPVTVSVAVILLGVGLACALGFWSILDAARKSREAGEELPEGYGALAYKNPDDPRIFVPKLFGMGQTLNFAHPSAWLILAVILALPALVIGSVLLATAGR